MINTRQDHDYWDPARKGFITNYPNFPHWKRIGAAQMEDLRPFNIYLHTPFCIQRCSYCYYKTINLRGTEKYERMDRYVNALCREIELGSQFYGLKKRPVLSSAAQLERLFARVKRLVNWGAAAEITFECEPGTLQRQKLEMLRQAGVTRLSLGVENLTDSILQTNGRAHLTEEIYRAYDWLQQVGFPQVNIDLIAGMVGETEENWSRCIEQARALGPDNITIYQMELPFNTLIAREMQSTGQAAPVADWPTKRRWVDQAFEELGRQGYHVSSAQELVRHPDRDHFVYRDQVWRGADLMAAGVASFGHVQGVHYQNLDQLTEYLEALEAGQLPHNRALRITPQQALIREFVLQLKEGRVDPATFVAKFGVNPLTEFAGPLARQQAAGYLSLADGLVTLTRRGLLQVDTLLTEYFEPEFRSVRYT